MTVSTIEDYRAAAQARRVVTMNNAAVQIAAAVVDKRPPPPDAVAQFKASREALCPSQTELLS